MRVGVYVCECVENACVFECMYACKVIIYSKSKDQPGKVASPARGQLNRKK